MNNSIDNIEIRQKKIIELFADIDNNNDKYEKIILLGKELAGIDENNKNTDNIVKGCQSQVWLISNLNKNNKIEFLADSDALIVRGLLSIVLSVYNNCSPDEIINNNINIFESIGMNEHLSPTRKNGLASILKQIKFYAMGYQILLNSKK